MNIKLIESILASEIECEVYEKHVVPALEVVKKALAQPAVAEQHKQEPVAWLHRQGNFTEACMNALHDDEIDRGWTQEPLYTTPPQRKPLTDEQFQAIKESLFRQGGWDGDGWDLALKEAIEAAHGIGEKK